MPWTSAGKSDERCAHKNLTSRDSSVEQRTNLAATTEENDSSNTQPARALRPSLLRTRSGVDPDVATEDFLRELNARNPSLGLDLDACRVRVSLRERAGTRSHVAEVDPAAFRRIMACPRLSLGWTVVRAAEDLHVPLCTFCANYGHGRSTCPNAAEPSRAVCTRCGVEGHVGVNCNVHVGSAAESCAPCRRAGLEAAGHAAGSEACPLLRERVARMRNRTDYGQT
ncbi:hypothetical protein HPB50_013249 [Hyalomma asiaticum]|uniref:Uncharacterized protein n=1 Tax=Hyalomma asiaticum TaxID=266040 RepID=A0ACB7RR46_HYAAI|nr:hypothetical protein HPB50_013249 [Hyalomma asiaticum]